MPQQCLQPVLTSRAREQQARRLLPSPLSPTARPSTPHQPRPVHEHLMQQMEAQGFYSDGHFLNLEMERPFIQPSRSPDLRQQQEEQTLTEGSRRIFHLPPIIAASSTFTRSTPSLRPCIVTAPTLRELTLLACLTDEAHTEDDSPSHESFTDELPCDNLYNDSISDKAIANSVTQHLTAFAINRNLPWQA